MGFDAFHRKYPDDAPQLWGKKWSRTTCPINVEHYWRQAGFNAEAVEDIHQTIWNKLICNIFVSGACALTGFTVGELVDCGHAKSVALACAKEADAVARQKGIVLSYHAKAGEGVSLSLTDDERLERYVYEFASTVRGARPSLAQDFAAGKRTEVESLHGAIVEEAKKVFGGAEGKTPANEIVANLIRAKETTF